MCGLGLACRMFRPAFPPYKAAAASPAGPCTLPTAGAVRPCSSCTPTNQGACCMAHAPLTKQWLRAWYVTRRLRCTGTGCVRSCGCCVRTFTGLHWSCGSALPRCVCVCLLPKRTHVYDMCVRAHTGSCWSCRSALQRCAVCAYVLSGCACACIPDPCVLPGSIRGHDLHHRCVCKQSCVDWPSTKRSMPFSDFQLSSCACGNPDPPPLLYGRRNTNM